MAYHPFLIMRAAIIASLVLTVCTTVEAAKRSLVLTDPGQDGYTNEGSYNHSDRVLVCGKQGFVVVVEFPLPKDTQMQRAFLHLFVRKVLESGGVELHHLQNFNNGFAETQDYYATARKVGEAEVQNTGWIIFDITGQVSIDQKGPGGFTSYRLESKGAELYISAYESGKDVAWIELR